MPQYMLQFTYTTDTWNALVANPVDRSAAVTALAKKMGGKFISLNYTMGDYDGVLVVEAADDTAVMALALAAMGPGHLKATKTTKLMTPAEAVAAMKKAQGAGYKGPGK